MATQRVLRHLFKALIQDDLDDLAAMMTYYAIFALFPMVVFVLALALLVLPAEVLGDAARLANQTLPQDISALLNSQIAATYAETSGNVAVVSGLIALWGASRGTMSLIIALNRVFETDEHRTWLRRQLLAVGVTLLVAALVVIGLGVLVLGSVVNSSLEGAYALGEAFDTLWSVGTLAAAAVTMTMIWIVLYKLLPDRDTPLRALVPGAIVGVGLWIAVSHGAAVVLTYVANFEATYGALTGAVTLLFWLWLSNLTLLIGAEIGEALSLPTDPAGSST